MLLSLNIVFVSANSVDPDEMQHDMAFHLGLHCLPKYAFKVHKGLINPSLAINSLKHKFLVRIISNAVKILNTQQTD